MTNSVMVTSAGRRVQLLDALERAMLLQSWNGALIAADASESAPATRIAQRWHRSPVASDPAFISQMRELCSSEHIRLIVPTIDTELPVWAHHRGDFADAGTVVAVSSAECIEITSDKLLFASWLGHNNLPAPRTYGLARDLTELNSSDFPLHAKPAGGSRSEGVHTFFTPAQLRECVSTSDDQLLVQELLVGPEYTVSCFVAADGRSRVEVPRERREVRAGEVAKGATVRDAAIEELARSCVEALPGAFGPLNVQIMVTPEGPHIIEVNARFGGGDPLAWAAGADIPRMLLAEVEQPGSSTRCDSWVSGVVMTRYDRAVYIYPDGHHELD